MSTGTIQQEPIVFVGSSIMALWESLPRFFPGQVYNVGILTLKDHRLTVRMIQHIDDSILGHEIVDQYGYDPGLGRRQLVFHIFQTIHGQHGHMVAFLETKIQKAVRQSIRPIFQFFISLPSPILEDLNCFIRK